MGLINKQVYLENNYELWKKMFEEEKEKLIKLFTDDNFEIEHVGSTAVEDLSAKPIVDIAIGVSSFDDFKKYIDKLSNLYTIKENYDNDEILLINEDKNETFFLIHVIPINCIRYKNMITFRNILRTNHDILKQYEMLKSNLADKYYNNRKLYTKLKNDFIVKILKNTNN